MCRPKPIPFSSPSPLHENTHGAVYYRDRHEKSTKAPQFNVSANDSKNVQHVGVNITTETRNSLLCFPISLSLSLIFSLSLSFRIAFGFLTNESFALKRMMKSDASFPHGAKPSHRIGSIGFVRCTIASACSVSVCFTAGTVTRAHRVTHSFRSCRIISQTSSCHSTHSSCRFVSCV